MKFASHSWRWLALSVVVGLALMPSKDRPTVMRITVDYAEVVTAAANRIRMPIRTEHPPIWT